VKNYRLWTIVGLLLGLGLGSAADAQEKGTDLSEGIFPRLSTRREFQSSRRDSAQVLSLVRPLCEKCKTFVCNVIVDYRPVALGTVVGEGGWAITKHSEISPGKLQVRLSDKRLLDAQVYASQRSEDVALLKFDAPDLKGILFDRTEPKLGSFLVSSGANGDVLSIGVVGSQPRAVSQHGILGISFPRNQSEVVVDNLLPGGGAAASGIKVGDRILKINRKPIQNGDMLRREVKELYAGEIAEIELLRGTETLNIQVQLRDESVAVESESDAKVHGNRSSRSGGFSHVLHHDSVLQPDEIGGPILDLEGNPLGINIARANRVSSYAIPAAALVPIIKRMLPQRE
jgi:S1-C subfamily serine protease